LIDGLKAKKKKREEKKETKTKPSSERKMVNIDSYIYTSIYIYNLPFILYCTAIIKHNRLHSLRTKRGNTDPTFRVEINVKLYCLISLLF
jgi:hypothetical protein